MSDIIETAAAPAEKVAAAIAKPLGLASSVRKVPDWAWVLLTVLVAFYGYRWWMRRRAARLQLVQTNAAAPMAPTAVAPAPSQLAPGAMPMQSQQSQGMPAVAIAPLLGMAGGLKAGSFGPSNFFPPVTLQ